jgi:predicted component of type VI protein secretion system
MSVKTRMLEHSSHRDQLREVRQRRHALEAEIATFASAADRADLRALFARYDDAITTQLRDILAHQEGQAERVADRRWRPVGGL